MMMMIQNAVMKMNELKNHQICTFINAMLTQKKQKKQII